MICVRSVVCINTERLIPEQTDVQTEMDMERNLGVNMRDKFVYVLAVWSQSHQSINESQMGT